MTSVTIISEGKIDERGAVPLFCMRDRLDEPFSPGYYIDPPLSDLNTQGTLQPCSSPTLLKSWIRDRFVWANPHNHLHGGYGP
jgi:hypothetical protein